MADNAYTSFLKDPDQAARRAELTAFIGPNPAKFLKAYDQQVATATRAPGERIKFSFFGRPYCWPAFFFGPVWFFYRKLYAWGAGITIVTIVIGLLPISNRIGIGLGVALAGVGPLVYLSHTVARIQALRQSSPAGAVDLGRLAAEGGVSPRAGWIAGILYGLVAALGIWSIVVYGPDGTRSPSDKTHIAAPAAPGPATPK